MADLYPTYGRQYQRQDTNGHGHYQLQGGSSNPSGVMYPPTLVTQQSSSAMVDDQPSPTNNDADSNSPSSQTASSPKQESPTGPKQDGIPSQPTKPQATFLTKLYACVFLSRRSSHRIFLFFSFPSS